MHTDRIPILKLGQYLLVTIQVDLYDELAERLESDIITMARKHDSRGILIDISAVSMVDSFMGRIFSNIASMAKLMDAETVLTGMQPAVAITLVELGLTLEGVHTALNVDDGIALLEQLVGSYDANPLEEIVEEEEEETEPAADGAIDL